MTSPATHEPPLLDVRGLGKVYHSAVGWGGRRHVVRAADDVTFQVARGEMFGLVGESGCGKSTVARCVLNLIRPTGGEVTFSGNELLALPPAAMRALRRDLQIIF